MEVGGEMLRRLAVTTAVTVAVGVAVPAIAQETVGFLLPLVDYLSTEAGADLEVDLIRDAAAVTDPANDYEHITGEVPGFTPDYIDISEGAIFEFDPGPAEVFGPTNRVPLWAPTGPREVVPVDYPPFFTYTTNRAKDGTQYGSGALLFRIVLREPPPPAPEGVCDYTVWVYDPSRGAAFQNLPQFPADPATGSNLAFGVHLTPERGGVPVAFALALGDLGEFQPTEVDTRAFLIGDTVVVTLPRQAVGDLAAVNYHAQCSAEGSAIEPSSSGADQTGLVSTSLAEAGEVMIMETPITATPTLGTTTTPRSATVATSEMAADPGPGVAVWAPAVAGTALLGAVGYWVFSRRRNPEEKALAAWRKAERSLASTEAEAGALATVCLQARSVIEELEHERIDLCRVWPPACLVEEDGEAGTSPRDQHFRRMALGEVWVDYKEGKIGAEEVEARWREVNTPEFRARMRETDEAYRETLHQLDAELAQARGSMETACGPASAATSRAETARQSVYAARKTYLETLESPPPPPAASWQVNGCDESAPRLTADGPSEQIRVNVGFMITIGRFAGRERTLERGERLILEMDGLLNELELVRAINRIRQGGTHAGWSGHEYEPGVYWVSGGGVRAGETTDGHPPFEKPAKDPTRVAPSDTALTDLPGTIGDHASTKVTGWMSGFETLTMQRTLFHQLVTSRPYTVWECRDGDWERKDRVWRVEVGEPLRNRGEVRWFTADSPGRRAQFETEVNRVAWVATGMVTRDLRRLLRWRAKHAPLEDQSAS